MRIGKLEIRWVRQSTSNFRVPTSDIMDLSGAFAVVDTEPWWRAVHQIIDQAEAETILGARAVTHDSNRCIAAVGSGEGCALIRMKLKEARQYALTHYRSEVGSRKS